MTRATWKIVDYGKVPIGAPMVEFDCPRCGRVALLPVVGVPLAQLHDGGIVFDIGQHAIPAQIQCRRCRRLFEE